jgi:putative aldouronate transport system permease protein
MLQTKGEKAFNVFNGILLILIALSALAPFVHVIAQSLSSHRAIVSGEVGLWPIEWNTMAYAEVFKDKSFWNSFMISVLRTVIGTFVNVLLASMLAYPLSRKYLKGRSVIMFSIVFTMMFNGGIIPTYLVVRELHLLNTFAAYIIPMAVGAFAVIVLKNFFQEVPKELEESALIDGASNVGIMFRIFIPLSMPALATMALFHAVAHWNSFFDAVIYVQNRDLFPLQVFLRELIQFNSTNANLMDNLERQMIANESLKAATLISATVPILVVYPALQKYFIKGMLIGSVKG